MPVSNPAFLTPKSFGNFPRNSKNCRSDLHQRTPKQNEPLIFDASAIIKTEQEPISMSSQRASKKHVEISPDAFSSSKCTSSSAYDRFFSLIKGTVSKGQLASESQIRVGKLAFNSLSKTSLNSPSFHKLSSTSRGNTSKLSLNKSQINPGNSEIQHPLNMSQISSSSPHNKELIRLFFKSRPGSTKSKLNSQKSLFSEILHPHPQATSNHDGVSPSFELNKSHCLPKPSRVDLVEEVVTAKELKVQKLEKRLQELLIQNAQLQKELENEKSAKKSLLTENEKLKGDLELQSHALSKLIQENDIFHEENLRMKSEIEKLESLNHDLQLDSEKQKIAKTKCDLDFYQMERQLQKIKKEKKEEAELFQEALQEKEKQDLEEKRSNERKLESALFEIKGILEENKRVKSKHEREVESLRKELSLLQEIYRQKRKKRSWKDSSTESNEDSRDEERNQSDQIEIERIKGRSSCFKEKKNEKNVGKGVEELKGACQSLQIKLNGLNRLAAFQN